MSVGKIIALLCGILAVMAFIFLINNKTPQHTNLSIETNKTADLALNDGSIIDINANIVSNEDLK